ncbi:hypothetical protein P3T76_011645 [Phytophthora citrophthora]|uniref:Uncharacterized protein n=1 Tax=Phytophthora citrophthora TaxID=4793 RepID=A0AAD9G8V5_9STRA|nr:hypothetical protein P3T76_011645 [Phytophthora citrophthora]
MANVLKYNYPCLDNGEVEQHPSQFGFIDIQEGTTVWPIDFDEGEGPTIKVSSSYHCRAKFSSDDLVEVLVPGLGLCQTRLGDGVLSISRDSNEQNLSVSSKLHSLQLSFAPFESVHLTIDLLALIGGNLQSLTLNAPIDKLDHDSILDLSVLSAVCPNLRLLTMNHFNVVVSIHNETLRRWPIEELTISTDGNLAGLTLCLRNTNLRMA